MEGSRTALDNESCDTSNGSVGTVQDLTLLSPRFCTGQEKTQRSWPRTMMMMKDVGENGARFSGEFIVPSPEENNGGFNATQVMKESCGSSNESVGGVQEITLPSPRFLLAQEKTQGTWPRTTTMMDVGENGVLLSGEFIPSPKESNGGFDAIQVMKEYQKEPLTSERIQVPNDLNNNGFIHVENRNPPVQRMYSLFGDGQPDPHYPTSHAAFNCGYFNPVVDSPVRNGTYLNIGNLNITSFPGQVQQNSIPVLGTVNNLLNNAKTLNGTQELLHFIEQSTSTAGFQKMLDEILGSMFEWMTGKYAHFVFGMVVDKCRYHQLLLIVNKAASEPDRFAAVAFTSTGSKSILRILKSIKKMPAMEIIIATTLRPRSYELLTHKIAAEVVKQCFLTFGEKPMILFLETLSQRLLDLATHKLGCLSLYPLIDSIKGGYRQPVLEHFADQSLFLANDPSGNFIIQYLLELNNKAVTEIIISRLTGNFRQLALKQGGSHVVEKCMSHSLNGLKVAISEITKKGNTLHRIAQDQFGNYVIQQALKQSKSLTDKKLYRQLLDALRPYYPSLMGIAKGRHVAKVIKDDIESQVETY